MVDFFIALGADAAGTGLVSCATAGGAIACILLRAMIAAFDPALAYPGKSHHGQGNEIVPRSFSFTGTFSPHE